MCGHGTAGCPDTDWPGEPGLGSCYTDAERSAVTNVFEQMRFWPSGYDRWQQEAFEAAFASYCGADYAVAVNSGGAALDLAMAALSAKPGDEVISCAINFPGTHLAVLGAGLRLVLAEPDPVTLNLDPRDISHRMTRRTRAILVTHMNGLPADLDAIETAASHRAAELSIDTPRIIVDAARAVGATTPDGPVGAQGWVTIFSFHRKKAITTLGEGGMLTTRCPATARHLRQMRSFGDHECWGSSYRITEFQAAAGQVQLRRLDVMNDTRIELARERTKLLSASTGGDTLMLPPEPAGYRHVYYLYTVLLRDSAAGASRDAVQRRLREVHGVGSVIANPPTYSAHEFIKARTAGQGPFPVAEETGRRILCTAVHPCMTRRDNARISEALAESVNAVTCGP
jgi:perosamine synthetase